MTNLKRLREWHLSQVDLFSVRQGLGDPHAETARILSVLEGVAERRKYTRGVNLYGKPADIIEGPAADLQALAELLGGGKWAS